MKQIIYFFMCGVIMSENIVIDDEKVFGEKLGEEFF